MTKEVLINISGLQMDVDPENPIEMVTTGAYYLKNGKHYILYDELSEDNEVTKNVLKIGPNSVELTRKGPQGSHMIFEEGKYYPMMKVQPGIPPEEQGQCLSQKYGPCLLKDKNETLVQYLIWQRKLQQEIYRQVSEKTEGTLEAQTRRELRLQQIRQELENSTAALQKMGYNNNL